MRSKRECMSRTQFMSMCVCVCVRQWFMSLRHVRVILIIIIVVVGPSTMCCVRELRVGRRDGSGRGDIWGRTAVITIMKSTTIRNLYKFFANESACVVKCVRVRVWICSLSLPRLHCVYRAMRCFVHTHQIKFAYLQRVRGRQIGARWSTVYTYECVYENNLICFVRCCI